jgi:hypothetical protein
MAANPDLPACLPEPSGWRIQDQLRKISAFPGINKWRAFRRLWLTSFERNLERRQEGL